jgi:hypothetical protein
MFLKRLPLVFICFLFWGCQYGNISNVKQQVIQKFANTPSGYIELKDFIDVKWDRFYVCEPYTYIDHLDQHLMPYKDLIMDSGISTRDDICVLVFLDDKKMVARAVINRGDIDFAGACRLDKTNHVIYFTPGQKLVFTKKSNARYTVINVNSIPVLGTETSAINF